MYIKHCDELAKMVANSALVLFPLLFRVLAVSGRVSLSLYQITLLVGVSREDSYRVVLPSHRTRFFPVASLTSSLISLAFSTPFHFLNSLARSPHATHLNTGTPLWVAPNQTRTCCPRHSNTLYICSATVVSRM
jgi:hypothetical protein